MIPTITRQWVECYAARNGRQVDYGTPTSAEFRERLLWDEGHNPRLHITFADGERLVTAILYVPAQNQVPAAG